MIAEYLPYTDADVREQVNRLFSRKMLGAVLVGKFVGDYAAILATGLLGVHLGYISGIILTISIFIYWERLERRIQKASNEMSGKQKTVADYKEER